MINIINKICLYIPHPEIDEKHYKTSEADRKPDKIICEGKQMNKKLEKISEQIKRHISLLREEYSIKEIGIFGSYTRGEESRDSDLDILVEMEKPVDLFKFLELEEKLSEYTGKKVDLVSKKALKPEIGKQILKEVIYL